MNFFPQKRRFGINFDGCEGALESLLYQSLTSKAEDYDYTVVEIGAAGCVTTRAFRDIVATYAGSKNWRVFGFDLTPDLAYSLDWPEINKAFDGTPNVLGEDDKNRFKEIEKNNMYLWLLKDPRSFLAKFPSQIDFCLIDGQHGISSGKDFLAIEPHVSEGGVVVFHDYGVPEQGLDWQANDREFISVRSYVHRLGLAEPRNERRQGWDFVGEIRGTRYNGGSGNSCAVLQRNNEPLVDQPELRLTP